MQENKSLKDFMKWFKQVVLQVESYSMNAILHIFKWSISPDILFFESLAKKPPISMDALFRWVDKYAMLENDVWVASHQILVTIRPVKNKEVGSLKPPNNQSRQGRGRQDGQQ